jgi:hypothetical protein
LKELKSLTDLSPCIPQIVIPSKDLRLSLPLSEEEKQVLIDACSRSGVGKLNVTFPVIDLKVRKSWELLPGEFTIENENEINKTYYRTSTLFSIYS